MADIIARAMAKKAKDMIEQLTSGESVDTSTFATKEEVAALGGAAPKSVFATLAALQANATANTLDGKKYVYLVTADSKWYFWNGSAWVPTADSATIETGIGIAKYSGLLKNTGSSLYVTATITAGRKYYYELVSYDGLNLTNVSVYLYRADNTNVLLKTSNLKEGYVFTATEDFTRLRFYANLSASETINYTLTVYVMDFTSASTVYNKIVNLQTDVTNLKSYVAGTKKLLVIGDSYSAQGRWINQLKTLMSISTVVNLAVSSATLKDSYTDHTTYPYTSRPISTANTGNLNTFACQIEKLKRLMAGIDLDAGEVKTYATTDTYPDIIIIEGGANDFADTDVVVGTYTSMLYTKLTGVYTKLSGGTAAIDNNAYIKTNINTVDRKSFMGAIRYLYEELHVLFPNALIYVVTPSGLSYSTGVNLDYLDVGTQMKKACGLLSLPVIDWGLNGRLTYIDNDVVGSGTLGDPYIINSSSEYSQDWLHPNDAGALLLAKEVAAVLKKY